MKRTEKGIPVLSWCLSIRNCEDTLEVTLKSIRERTPQAEIVIVDNMSRDSSPEIAKRYADVYDQYKGPKGTWTVDDPWTYNMANSRQRAFELASGRWRGWIDSDDRLPGAEEAEKLLKLNAQWEPGGSSVVKGSGKPEGLEDILLQLEEKHPNADCVWAPYLYAKDEHGQAYTWQQRERIIKWSVPTLWHWSEAAHEILVPVEGYKPSIRIEFAHLLFIHERKFDNSSVKFSTDRHFDVLHRQYQEGDRTTRRCLYLTAYSQVLCPERESEFIDAAYAAATTTTDRYRVLAARGQMFVRQGLLIDALEAFGAANNLRPDLPDVWFLGGDSWVTAEDWPRAAEWLEKGIACRLGDSESQVAPRHHLIRYPILLSEVYRKIAKLQTTAKLHSEALSSLSRAMELAEKVKKDPCVGSDLQEAHIRKIKVSNDLLAEANAVNIGRLADYLVKNDEPKKALELLKTVPWNLQNHPIVIDMERKLAPVAKHLVDPVAYKEFYGNDLETGYIESEESWLDPKNSLERVAWIANWLNKNAPNARVLDVGCFDGIVGIPILKTCPGINYTAVDVYQKPLDVFRERAHKLGMADRTNFVIASDWDKLEPSSFDVVIWSEVIEHVVSPLVDLRKIKALLRPGGQAFITTPWGAFDAGTPPEKTAHGKPRDSRGHVRVLTARDCVNVFDEAGMQVEDLAKMPVPDDMAGDGLHAQVSNQPSSSETPVSFVVPGALWDWNGRSVDVFGMGASEKSIVQISSDLAVSYRKVEVYGPVPNDDVYRGVRYWSKDQLRHVRHGKIVISRSPGFAPFVDDAIGKKLPKILWLQDAWYPELDAKTVENYETIVVVSEWHKRAMHDRHGVPLDKMTVIYNPVDAKLYDAIGKVQRKSDSFVYCSSPDRGLIPLLELWPRILEALPTATLDIFYGWRGCQKLGLGSDASWTKRYEASRRKFELLRHQKGISVRDMVNPALLANTFLAAGVWAYPVIDFHETCCTAALEARAAGCVPVAPPLAALTETARCDQGFLTPIALDNLDTWKEVFFNACILATQVSDEDRLKMSREAIAKYRIENSTAQWRELLK